MVDLLVYMALNGQTDFAGPTTTFLGYELQVLLEFDPDSVLSSNMLCAFGLATL